MYILCDAFFYFTFVIEGKTVCAGCKRGGCSGGCTGGGGIIAGVSFVVEDGTNTFFGSGFFGVTGTHSFSENEISYNMDTLEYLTRLQAVS